MELLLVLILVVACIVVGVIAKNGAERELRAREERWARPPVPGGGEAWPGALRAGSRPTDRQRVRPREGAAVPRAEVGGATGGPAQPRTAQPRTAQAQAVQPRSAEPQAAGPRPAQGRSTRPQRGDAERPRGVRSSSQPRSEPPARRTRPEVETAAPININEAPAEELRNLPGVGVRAAERIEAHRRRFGNFASVDGLQAVEGFDHHRVSLLSDYATV